MNKEQAKLIFVNCITGLRAIGAFLLIPLFLNLGPFSVGMAFLAFVATDWVDGFCARKLGVSTFFGAIFDGMVDKMFGIIALVILASLIPGMILPALIEGAILAVGLYSAKKGNTAQSSMIGKVKEFVLAFCVTIGFFASDYATVQSVFNFINLPSLCNDQILAIIKGTTVCATLAESATLVGYIKRDQEETHKKITKKLNKQVTTKEKLEKIKEEIEYIKVHKKDGKEIMEELFSPSYYVQHKNDDVFKLLLKK